MCCSSGSIAYPYFLPRKTVKGWGITEYLPHMHLKTQPVLQVLDGNCPQCGVDMDIRLQYKIGTHELLRFDLICIYPGEEV